MPSTAQLYPLQQPTITIQHVSRALLSTPESPDTLSESLGVTNLFPQVCHVPLGLAVPISSVRKHTG